jgi:hypothetical protein
MVFWQTSEDEDVALRWVWKTQQKGKREGGYEKAERGVMGFETSCRVSRGGSGVLAGMGHKAELHM